MAKRGRNQPPPAPKKKRIYKNIKPSDAVKRKLNFDDNGSETGDLKKTKLDTQQCRSCELREDEAPVQASKEDAASVERDSTSEREPKCEDKLKNNEENEESEGEKVKSADLKVYSTS